MFTIPDGVKRVLERDGSEIIWLAKMYLGPFAFLRITNYSLGTGDSFTIIITKTDATTISTTFTAGTDFALGGSNEICASNIATAIQQLGPTDRLNAFATGAVVILYGKAHPVVAQATPIADKLAITSSSDAWDETAFAPIDRVYNLVSGQRSDFDDPDIDVIPELASVSNLSRTIDPFTLKTAVSSVELVIEDPNETSVFRSLAHRSFPKGKLIELSYGTRDIDTLSFVPAGTFVIDEMIPDRGRITITASDLGTALRDKTYANVVSPVGRLQCLAIAPGSGAVVEVHIWTANAQYTVTLTEGVEWLGDSAPSLASRSLRDAINNSAVIRAHGLSAIEVNTVVGVIEGIIYVIPMQHHLASAIAETDIVFRIEVSTSNSSVVVASRISFQENLPGGLESVFISPKKQGFISQHPIHALRHLCRRCGIDTARMDAASFEKATYTTISHYAASAHDAHWITDREELGFVGKGDNAIVGEDGAGLPALDIVDDLCQLVQGALVATESGTIKFIRRDRDAAAIRHLASDVDFDQFEWLETYQSLKNEVNVLGVAFGSGDDLRVWCYSKHDEFSQAMQTALGSSSVQAETIEHPFLGTFTQCVLDVSSNELPDATDTAVTILGAWRSGFCGAHLSYSNSYSASKPSGAELSSTRPCYILLWQPVSGASEIVKSTSATGTANGIIPFTLAFGYPSDTQYKAGTDLYNADVLHAGPINVFDHWIYTIARGQLGTTARDFSANPNDALYAADITMAVGMADHVLDFAYGNPRASFRTTRRHGDLEIGDVITHDDSQYLDLLSDGTTVNTTWWIIGKEFDGPWIKWTISLLKRAFVPNTAIVHVISLPQAIPYVIPTPQMVTDNSDIPITTNADEFIYR